MKRPRPAGDRPYVLLNMAISADGKIASANRAVESFGSPRDQAHLLDLRASVDAVLCGARTASAPDVTLGTGGAKYQRRRTRHGVAPRLLRVIVSGSARVRPDAGVFRHDEGSVIVITTESAPGSRLRRLRRVAGDVVSFGRSEVDLAAALRWLRHQHGVRRLVCEGGGELNDAMFRAGLIDEVHLTICPKVIGGRTAPTIADGRGFPSLPDAARLQLHRRRRIGDELFVCYHVLRR